MLGNVTQQVVMQTQQDLLVQLCAACAQSWTDLPRNTHVLIAILNLWIHNKFWLTGCNVTQVTIQTQYTWHVTYCSMYSMWVQNDVW